MAKVSRLTSWIKHLAKRRGSHLISQSVRMFYFHMQPFHKLLDRMFTTLDEYDSGFTFPLVASIGEKHQDYVRFLKSYPFEIAIHGYKHVRYQHLSPEQVEQELILATKAFQKLKLPFKGFRAPYNNYSEATKELLQKFDFLWDIGIGYQQPYQETHQFFNYKFNNGKKSTYTCIPLSKWSDD
ncbi:MAG: polysaccharide deacetylase family protein, partial [Candidatus Heimdallarchaeota archaeon]|nr:polysaccharide deacetylase family protein [Candidatus Heimdallarchaeota archaeon]